MSEPIIKNPLVIIKTTKGDFTLRLFADKAPLTVASFLSYVDEGFYNGTVFHRVIEGFMIQGGGFTKEMKQKSTHPPIRNEAKNGLKNKRGTVAMARTSVVDSATAQFFVNVVDNSFLDFRSADAQGFGYCVFGEVVSGLETVDAIRKLKTGSKNSFTDVPLETVEILDVTCGEAVP